jgi:hypothetical protein
MRKKSSILLAVALAAASRLASASEAARAGSDGDDGTENRPRLMAELGCGPLIGIDSPLRGASAGLLVGLGWGPLEAGLRAGAAFDRSLGSASVRLDLELGLGGGMRVVVGGLVPLAPPVLEPEGAAIALEAPGWPCRFGLSAEIAELPFGHAGSRVAAFAEIVYCAYRVSDGSAAEAASALSGAAAFAACVEVSATISIAWGLGRGAP